MIKVIHWRAVIFPAPFFFGTLLHGCGPRAPELRPPRADSIRTSAIAPGLSYQYRWYGNGPVAVHELTIEPRACVAFRTMKAGDRVVGREQTSALAARAAVKFGVPVLAATNADFFSFEPPGVPEGPQISDGTLIKSEGTHREAIDDRLVRLQPVFAVARDGQRLLSHTRFIASVRRATTTAALAGVNVKPRRDAVVLYDSMYGAATPPDSSALELVLRATEVGSGVVGRIDSAIAGVDIPERGAVLHMQGSARESLGAVSEGDTISWTYRFENVPANLRELIGGYPMLLVGGRAVHHDEARLRTSFSDRQHPRSAIAIDRHGGVHIFAVDGRQPGYSVGMSLQQLGEYLLTHGYRDALALDGGGSTTLVVGGRVVNRPSDSEGERAVSNALLVLASVCR